MDDAIDEPVEDPLTVDGNAQQSLSDIFDAAAILCQREGYDNALTAESYIHSGETEGQENDVAEMSNHDEVLMDEEEVIFDNGFVAPGMAKHCNQFISNPAAKKSTGPVKVEVLINKDIPCDGLLIGSMSDGGINDSYENDDNNSDEDQVETKLISSTSSCGESLMTDIDTDGSTVHSDVEFDPPHDNSSSQRAMTKSFSRPPPSKRSKKKKKAWPPKTGASSSANKLFLCPYCDMSAHSLENIHEHIKQSHPMTGKHKCSRCNYATDLKFGLDLHNVIHTTTPPYHCTKCSFKCNMDFQLNKHINVHTGEKHFKCSQCNYGTDHTTNFRRHMERHSRSTGTSCQFCSYSCFNMYQLQKHVERSHPEKITPEFARTFKIIRNYEQQEVEEMTPSDGDEVQLKFDKAPKSIGCESPINKPVRTKKKATQYEFPPGVSLKRDSQGRMSCIYCDYKTAWHTNLKRHYATHEPKSCQHCGFSSPDKKLFLTHLRSHDPPLRRDNREGSLERLKETSTVGEYTCSVCTFSTNSQRMLRRHEKDHMLQNLSDGSTTGSLAKTREKRQTQKRHDDEFIEGSDIDETLKYEEAKANRSGSNSQRSVDHNNLSKPSNDKLACSECDFTCNHESWLITHMRQHLIGKTEHKCTFCAYTAPNPHRLKAHLMTHTGNKPYKCPRCHFASSNSSNLYRHIRKKHNPDDVDLAKRSRDDLDTFDDEDLSENSQLSDSSDLTEEDDKAKTSLVIFRCTDCEFTTTFRESLEDHKEVHAKASFVVHKGSLKKEVKNQLITGQHTNPANIRQNVKHNIRIPEWKMKLQAEMNKTVQLVDRKRRKPVLRPKEGAPFLNCRYCNFKTQLKVKLSYHLVTWHINKHNCCHPSCVFRSSSKYYLDRHRRLLHNNNVAILRQFSGLKPGLKFICKKCGFETSHKHDWGVHFNKHALEQLKQLSTSLIPKKTSTKMRLLTQNNNENTFSCPQCDFTCRRKDMFVAHVKQHSKKTSVSKCDQCSYATSNPYNLMKHKRTHTGEKPFKCSYCPYRSADSGNLNKHINSHHGVSKTRRAVVRKKNFKSIPKSVNVPQQEAPKKVESPKQVTQPPVISSTNSGTDMRFKCTECEYICTNEDFLIAHLSIHRKEGDQYVCSVCHYASRNQQNLAKHIRTHTGEKPYKCSYCTYSAADKGNLNKHVKTHHKALLISADDSSTSLDVNK